MPGLLLPHRAGYAITRPDGTAAGTESLLVRRGGSGWRIESHLETTWPEEVVATVDWELDQSMITRFLHIQSRERHTGDHDLELTISGNGLLAHRSAPDGPTQVELGWGPNAELDYISAAFPVVMMARSPVPSGTTRNVDAVQLGTLDLVPTIVPVVVLGLDADVADGGRAGLTTVDAARVEWRVAETGHTAEIATTWGGALAAYSGLLRLDWLEPTK